jgi:hypothetical protein
MKYEKPEIVATVPAIVAVQSSQNKGPYDPSDISGDHATSSAYEADE